VLAPSVADVEKVQPAPLRHGIDARFGDEVLLRVPADPLYVSLVRTAAASLAARLEVGLDRLDDLRLAVDEACALLMQHADSDQPLECLFRLDGAKALQLQARVRSDGRPLRTSGFTWTVLTALVDDVTVDILDGDVVIAMTLSADGLS
jgi:serine/threonine-protein kinase RsbW